MDLQPISIRNDTLQHFIVKIHTFGLSSIFQALDWQFKQIAFYVLNRKNVLHAKQNQPQVSIRSYIIAAAIEYAAAKKPTQHSTSCIEKSLV